jgi:predicted HTH transcriptional regulator
MIELSDEELNRMRRDTENSFVERKTVSDKRGWLHTAVAFANSVPIDYPAVLFVGINDDGTLQQVAPDHDWERQQKTVNEELNRAYPPLYVLPKIIRDEQGREFLAVIVPGSPQRPHFTGKAYIRVGPETKEASEEQFDNLIVQRSSKVYEILKWKGKTVTVDISIRQVISGTSYSQGTWPGTVEDCNNFWVSLLTETKQPVVCSLALVDLSFDSSNNRLRLLLWQT